MVICNVAISARPMVILYASSALGQFQHLYSPVGSRDANHHWPLGRSKYSRRIGHHITMNVTAKHQLCRSDGNSIRHDHERCVRSTFRCRSKKTPPKSMAYEAPDCERANKTPERCGGLRRDLLRWQ